MAQVNEILYQIQVRLCNMKPPSGNLHFTDILVGWSLLIMLCWPMFQSRLPFSKSKAVCMLLLVNHFRDQSYITRIQLTALDHNHLNWDKAQNKQGELMYAQKFQKQTKKWDATPTIGILFQTIKYLLLDLRSLVFSETNKIN